MKKNLESLIEPLSAGACWLTLNAMVEVERPGEENAWRDFGSSQKIAWKTGTSFGFRDAWAIGVTPRYAVGIWVGNADGEGRPGLVGSQVAAPILFDLFDMLEKSPWFEAPASDLVQIKVCSKSGHRAGIYCDETEFVSTTSKSLRTSSCSYCRNIHLDASMRWQVNTSCELVSNIQSKNWFVLPPAMEYFYKKRHSDYKPLPPYRADCVSSYHGSNRSSLSIIYPSNKSKIYVPLELDSRRGKTVFQAAHRDCESRIYWHLDNQYIGITSGIHQMSFSPGPGQHVLTLVDDSGERIQRHFTILSKEY